MITGPSVNIVREDNGRGLSRSAGILAAALRDGGCRVATSPIWPPQRARVTRRVHLQRVRRTAVPFATSLLRRGFMAARRTRYDLNIFLESIAPSWTAYARVNCFVPNQEVWPSGDVSPIRTMDAVLAKTRYAEQLFTALAVPTHFVSFTSDDRRLPGARPTPRFLHLGSRGNIKNTDMVVDAWLPHPAWPTLTIVDSRPRLRRLAAANVRVISRHVPDGALRALQNAHAFHLAPSPTEGFGHRINEALSCGTVCITTDGPPMNELVTPERGLLVGTTAEWKQGLGVAFELDPADFDRQVERAIAMDEGERARLGAAGRAWFEENDAFFRRRIVEVVRGLA